MVPGLGRQRLTDLLADMLHVVQIEAAIAVAGGADAYQTDVAVMHCGPSVGAHQQPIGSDALSHELLEARLEHGRVARCHQRHLLRIHVDADRGMTVVRQTRGGHATDIAEAENTNAHVHPPRRSSGMPPQLGHEWERSVSKSERDRSHKLSFCAYSRCDTVSVSPSCGSRLFVVRVVSAPRNGSLSRWFSPSVSWHNRCWA